MLIKFRLPASPTPIVVDGQVPTIDMHGTERYTVVVDGRQYAPYKIVYCTYEEEDGTRSYYADVFLGQITCEPYVRRTP